MNEHHNPDAHTETAGAEYRDPAPAYAGVAPPAAPVMPPPAGRSLNPPSHVWLPILGLLQLVTLAAVAWMWSDVPPPAPPPADLSPVRGDVAGLGKKVADDLAVVAGEVKHLGDEQAKRQQLTAPQVEKLAAAATNAGMIDESLKKWETRLTSLETTGKDWAKESEHLRTASGDLKKVPDAIKLKIEASLDAKVLQAMIAEASNTAAAKVAADGKKALDDQQKAFDAKLKAFGDQQAAALVTVKAGEQAVKDALADQLKQLKANDLAEVAKRLVATESATTTLTARIAELANKDAKAKRQDVAVVLFHSKQLDAGPFVTPVQDAVLDQWGKVPGVRYGVFTAHTGTEREVLLPLDAATRPSKFADLKAGELEAAEKADDLDPHRLFPKAAKEPAPPKDAPPPLKRVVLVLSDTGGPPAAAKDPIWKEFAVDAVVVSAKETPHNAANFLAWARFCAARSGVAIPVTAKDNLRATFDRLVAPR